MADWKGNKGSGPWAFTEQLNKWGYLNNPRWSNRQDSINFCAGLDLETGLSSEHKPCGHWHKTKYFPLIAGKWVAAMQQPGTPYIYLYDIEAKAVIRVNTSIIPVIVDGIAKLNSAYALDYDMGYGNPGAQRGAYCMNKNGTRIWYLFCDQGQYPIVRGHPDAELVEVDITSYYMKVVKRTLFPNLLPADPFPGPNWGRINDGCSDDTYTYWCTQLVAGRTIKIRNSDHVIVDDHYFNYPIEACSGNSLDEAITTIEAHKSTGKLYWIYCRDHLGCVPPYNACRHLIRADADLVADIDSVACANGAFTPAYQNMVRIYSNYIFQHRAYHPSIAGYLMKKNLSWVPVGDQVEGTDGQTYSCILDHISDITNKPTTGGLWSTCWILDGTSGGMWSAGENYASGHFLQEYLQNILGIKDNKLFTLMYVNNINHPAFLYCLNFNDMNEISRLDVSYYAGQIHPPGGYGWDWTSVSAMNQQTGVIAIFRYNNYERRNYAGCFSATSSLGFLCDVRFERVYDDPTLGPFGEPQSWPFEGFVPPEIPPTDPPIEVISDPGPGEIIYVPPPPPPDGIPDDSVTLLQSGFQDWFDIGPGQILYFKFISYVPDALHPIQVSSVTPASQPKTIDMLIRKGSKPSLADRDLAYTGGNCSHWHDDIGWYPEKPSGAEDLYYCIGVGTTEFVVIDKPMAQDTFYIMLYNYGTTGVRNQRLIVTC
jgi:hypothetical protein